VAVRVEMCKFGCHVGTIIALIFSLVIIDVFGILWYVSNQEGISMAKPVIGVNERKIKMSLEDFERHCLRAIEQGGINVGIEELLANAIRLVRQHADLVDNEHSRYLDFN
jgi:hypothetical protein